MFVGFWDGDYISQLPYGRYYVVVNSSFKHTREEFESNYGPMCFTYLYLVCQDLMSCYFALC